MRKAIASRSPNIVNLLGYYYRETFPNVGRNKGQKPFDISETQPLLCYAVLCM